jgi:hypothetical protein
MPREGSRRIRRVATVALMGGFITLTATPALAATAGGPAPNGTRVTGPWEASGVAPDGLGWADGNPWHGIVRPDGDEWIGSTPATDGHPWHDGHPWAGLRAGTEGEPSDGSIGAAVDGHPWHNLLAPDGHGWIEGGPATDGN